MTVLVGDCGSDPPLSATARTLALRRADDLVYGLGMVAVARGHAQLAFAVRHDDAAAALAEAIARAHAKVELWRGPAAWPTILPLRTAEREAATAAVARASSPVVVPETAGAGGAAAHASERADGASAHARGSTPRERSGAGALPRPSGLIPDEVELVDARVLVAAADAARGRPVRAYLTVAGAVARPSVVAVEESEPVWRVVARAGVEVDDWVVVGGGAPRGRLLERDALVRDSDGMLLVLPATHEIVRRLRTPISDWLLRAASACEGCRVCSESCPSLQPHEIVWTLATARDDGTAPAAALACIGCGLCDAVCPSALSPRALVVDVRDRMVRLGASQNLKYRDPSPSGLDAALLTARLGLTPYDKPVGVGV